MGNTCKYDINRLFSFKERYKICLHSSRTEYQFYCFYLLYTFIVLLLLLNVDILNNTLVVFKYL